MFTISDLLDRYRGVSRVTIVSWIESGELAAMDVAPSGSNRKRLRVTRDALADFERARSIAKPVQPVRELPKNIKQYI